MAIKLAINGYGRIGRNLIRAIVENNLQWQFDVVGINDLGDAETNAHLTQYDTVHGRFPGEVTLDGDHLVVASDRFRVFAERDPAKLPWKDLDVDVVLECTGRFRTREAATQHITAGAKKVLISAPGKEVDATVVYGVNEQDLKADHQIVSNASCTTNCLAPMARVLHELVGIQHGLMTTIHAFTNDQVLIDKYHKDLHRARAASQSIIPTTTGAARAVGLVLPELDGRLDGYAIRVPTVNVSLVDLTFTAARDTTTEEINTAMQQAADGKIIGYSEKPLVSVDYNHSPQSCNFDAGLTRVSEGRLVKACAWYDNEWGFSNRMLDTALAMMSAES